MSLELCPCGSSKPLVDCCLPLLQGEALAITPEQLMRSRYTAYSKKDFDYIVQTWHTSTRPAHLAALLAQDSLSTEWQGLTIIDTYGSTASSDEAFVVFFARFNHNQRPDWIYETSRFVRENNRWYYIDGVHKIPGRNELCPCGSEKKFKKCCAN